jgi:tetratricopeptide (TPR) repeat protein
VAELMLAQRSMTPRQLIEYLEREESRLVAVVSKAALSGLRIEALAKDGQFARARHLLEDRRKDLAEHDYERLETLVVAEEGGDARSRMEAIYAQTRDPIDLQNLVAQLRRDRDWKALRPLLRAAFERERTLDNACRFVECLQHDPVDEAGEIVAFLDANRDLVDRSPYLASAKAWAFFHLGHWAEARATNDRLLVERDELSDLALDINLALQSGEWERFGEIVAREWPRRSDRSPEILMQLASVAAEVDVTTARAFELANLAAQKAPTDPQVLLGAYALAVQLGRDEEADMSWLTHAADLSTDDGPVWKVAPRKVIEEILPAHRDRTEKIEQSLLKGEVPLHFAAPALNVPLASLLLDLPRRNASQSDGRRRLVLPIVSGARRIVEIQDEWNVGFDVTSLLMLAHLGLLGPALDAVSQAMVAPDTMTFLLNQRRKARFHQPSRVLSAQEICGLIDSGKLKTPSSLPEPPVWLVEEVGRDLAQLLEAARREGGRVLHPSRVHKLSTFLEEEAELGDYRPLLLSTADFARMLLDRGRLDAAKHDRARAYLLLHDRETDADSSTSALDRPLMPTEWRSSTSRPPGSCKTPATRNWRS